MRIELNGRVHLGRAWMSAEDDTGSSDAWRLDSRRERLAFVSNSVVGDATRVVESTTGCTALGASASKYHGGDNLHLGMEVFIELMSAGIGFGIQTIMRARCNRRGRNCVCPGGDATHLASLDFA